MFKELFTESTITCKDGSTITGNITDEDSVRKLAREYDWYTSRIDDGGQRRKAEDKNEDIKKELKKLGVTKISKKIDVQGRKYDNDIKI